MGPSEERTQNWPFERFCRHHESGVSGGCEKDDAAVDELVRVVAAEDNRPPLRHILLPQYDNVPEKLMHTKLHNQLRHVVEAK